MNGLVIFYLVLQYDVKKRQSLKLHLKKMVNDLEYLVLY